MQSFPNRRHFIQSSLALVAAMGPSVLAQVTGGQGVPRVGGKKGYAIGPGSPEWSQMVTDLNAKWIYSWGPKRPAGVPEGVDWVPMIHNDKPTSPALKALELVKAEQTHRPTALLGFNEPDQKSQGDMTVEQALALWPKLEELNIPLGSPSGVHADCEWMQSFMKQAKKLKYRIDFVTIHWYGDANSSQFMSHVDRIAKLYKLPVWITEFCPGDWSAAKTGKNKHSEKDVLRFIKDTLPQLERASHVQRYAWFCATPKNAALGCSALFDDAGKLTPLGEAYAKEG
jgi:hypothetical protein